MHDDDLKRELQRLADRLERVEQRLGISDDRARQEVIAPKPPPIQPRQERQMPPAPPVAATPPTIPSAVARAQREVVSKKLILQNLQVGERKQGGESSLPLRGARTPLTAAPSLELLIGGKWMAWAGALVVLLAVAFAIMVGVQRGWWGRISPQWRCLGIALFGAVLLLGGEIALRRIGRAASVGLFGAGLGTLYLDAYASFQRFELVSNDGAFILMAIVAIVGFGITLRTRFLTIGVLSIVGGYLTPLLLHGQSTRDLELLCFLTMLLGISLGLSAVQARDFRPLRYVAFSGQIPVAGLWVLANARTDWQLAIIFASVWWVMIVAESIYAAVRRQTALSNVVMVLLSTAVYVVAGCSVLRSGPSIAPAPLVAPASSAFPGLVVSNWLGLFMTMIAMLSAAAAFHFGDGLEGLRRIPRTAIEKLAFALWAQAGILFVVAIGLQFRGFAESIGWLAIGFAAIEIGRRLPSRGVTTFGLIAGGLALFRIAALDWWITPGMQTSIWAYGDLEINKWSLLALATIMLMLIAAHRVAPIRAATVPPTVNTPTILTALAIIFWFALCAAQCQGLSATAGWLLGVVALLATRRSGERQRYFEIAIAALIATAGRWLLLDAARNRLDAAMDYSRELPVLNWQMALAAAIALAAWWVYRISKMRPTLSAQAAGALQVAIIAGGVFALIALSFEIDRALMRAEHAPGWRAVWNPAQLRFLWWTGLWALGGLIMMLIGRGRGLKNIVMAGWGIVALAAASWLTIDTLFWRVNEGATPATVAMNLQFTIGVFTATLLGIAMRSVKESQRRPLDVFISLGLIAAIGLWAGSLEIDRLFAHVPQVRQAGLSVYWGCYGGLLVVLGFFKRSAPARYVGLGLLTLTAGKVLLIDFAYLNDLPRVISTLVAGLLLIGTSMLYMKLSPRLLNQR